MNLRGNAPAFRRIDFRDASQTLWNDEYLIGPGVLDFAARRITAYVHISPTGIEWADDVSGLVRN